MSLGVCSVSKTEPWISSYCNFTQIDIIKFILRNVIFNGSSFAKSKTAIGFVASTRVWEWSQFLISSPSWSCIQNKAKINLIIYRIYRKTWLFANYSKYKHIIYCWKLFFNTSMDSRSLPQNKILFGSNQLARFCHFAQKKHANDLDTFVANRGYHLKSQDRLPKREVNWVLKISMLKMPN